MHIDIIIPSFRAQPEYVLPILQLDVPAGCTARFYLVIDNPGIIPDKAIQLMADKGMVTLIINPQNMGTSYTRNTGIDICSGDWILFLDDDVSVSPGLLHSYKRAFDLYPEEIGFIGLVTLPPPSSDFTRAVVASGAINIFGVAARKHHFAWGATANMMISRKATGNIRFSLLYPKAGGGEDIDFFLKVRKANNYKDYKTVKDAEVWHPWWNGGRLNLLRSFRYGQGTAWLIKLNPEYTRYDFPNTPEIFLASVLLLLPVMVLHLPSAKQLAIFALCALFIEIAASYIHSLRNDNRVSGRVLAYVVLLKLFYDAGITVTNIREGMVREMFKRFNDNGSLKKDHFIRLNRYKITKMILYIALFVYLILYR